MRPFALAIPGYRLGMHSNKRARREEEYQDPAGSPTTGSDTEVGTQVSSTSHLPSDTINPLSHTPETLHQLAVAGLSPGDELPSQLYPGFPNKPLPAKSPLKRRGYDSNGVETPSTKKSRKSYGVDVPTRSDRVRHISTLTAIMHRSLRDGDITRAKRAFWLLVRIKDVNVLLDNLWTIGSEILMRDGEKEQLNRSTSRSQAHTNPSDTEMNLGSDSDSDSILSVERIGDEDAQREQLSSLPPQRWGSASNIAQVKTYLETLISHHPYDRHRPYLTSAIDFWPALFGIEIYNLNTEYQTALHKIRTENPLPSHSPSPSPPPEISNYSDSDSDYKMNLKTRTTRRRKSDRIRAIKDEPDVHEEEEEEEEEEDSEQRAHHYATDVLRTTTQQDALDLAARLDNLLESSPFSTHAELLRLRAHVSLFIADLHLPSRLTSRHDRVQASVRRGPRAADLALRARARLPSEHVALEKRGEEMERARGFFRRVVAAKGVLEGWVRRFVAEDDDDEDDEEE
ncbi:hypothetical protein GGS21DRAFT_510089 [Xylaria nigripes]|nr:hypothetical protein GGS21DRAFT_510089 [Xylaria nigripes]